MGSAAAALYLILSDFERSSSRSVIQVFHALTFLKGIALGHILLLKC